MAINYRKAPKTPAESAISLSKMSMVAGDLVGKYETAKISLRKRNLVGQRAAVYLVIDHSGSMRKYFKDGSVQALAEQALALAAHLDDDGVVPVIFFDTVAHPAVEVVLGQHQGAIERIRASIPKMGQTNYEAAMDAVIAHYLASAATDPALVVFQTDGAPHSRKAATQALCRAAELPLFWQFIGFGADDFQYLRTLDELPVPQMRRVDNAGFFTAGPQPRMMADSVLYEQLVAEYPSWLASATAAGIIRS
jgi:hypothetical protein